MMCFVVACLPDTESQTDTAMLLDSDSEAAVCGDGYDPYWTRCACCGKRHVTVCWTLDWQTICNACIDSERLLPADQKQLKAERADQFAAKARDKVPDIESLGDPEPDEKKSDDSKVYMMTIE